MYLGKDLCQLQKEQIFQVNDYSTFYKEAEFIKILQEMHLTKGLAVQSTQHPLFIFTSSV